MLYCNNGCSRQKHWTDKKSGCQKSAADDYCKLKHCNAGAFSSSFQITTALNGPGFACEASSCGQVACGKKLGNWFGITNVHFNNDILASHGAGNVVTNVKCFIPGKWYCSISMIIVYRTN